MAEYHPCFDRLCPEKAEFSCTCHGRTIFACLHHFFIHYQESIQTEHSPKNLFWRLSHEQYSRLLFLKEKIQKIKESLLKKVIESNLKEIEELFNITKMIQEEITLRLDEKLVEIDHLLAFSSFYQSHNQENAEKLLNKFNMDEKDLFDEFCSQTTISEQLKTEAFEEYTKKMFFINKPQEFPSLFLFRNGQNHLWKITHEQQKPQKIELLNYMKYFFPYGGAIAYLNEDTFYYIEGNENIIVNGNSGIVKKIKKYTDNKLANSGVYLYKNILYSFGGVLTSEALEHEISVESWKYVWEKWEKISDLPEKLDTVVCCQACNSILLTASNTTKIYAYNPFEDEYSVVFEGLNRNKVKLLFRTSLREVFCVENSGKVFVAKELDFSDWKEVESSLYFQFLESPPLEFRGNIYFINNNNELVKFDIRSYKFTKFLINFN